MTTPTRIDARVAITSKLPTQSNSSLKEPWPITLREPKTAAIAVKKSATSANRAVLLTKSPIIATRSNGESKISGGDPIPPGLPNAIETTDPPERSRPGSSNRREGWMMNSILHGDQSTIGVTTNAIRRRLRASISSFVREECVKAKRSIRNKPICHDIITMNVSGEKAQTIACKIANHHVRRQLSDSSRSN